MSNWCRCGAGAGGGAGGGPRRCHRRLRPSHHPEPGGAPGQRHFLPRRDSLRGFLAVWWPPAIFPAPARGGAAPVAGHRPGDHLDARPPAGGYRLLSAGIGHEGRGGGRNLGCAASGAGPQPGVGTPAGAEARWAMNIGLAPAAAMPIISTISAIPPVLKRLRPEAISIIKGKP